MSLPCTKEHSATPRCIGSSISRSSSWAPSCGRSSSTRARHGRLSVNERIGVAAMVFWSSQILSYVMVFSFEPFYDIYTDAPERLFGLSALTDQKLAGVVMMIEQTLTIGIAMLLLVRLSRRRTQRCRVTLRRDLPVVVHLRACLRSARGRGRLALAARLAGRGGTAAGLARSVVLARAPAVRRSAELTTRDDRRSLPRSLSPPAERRDRRLGARRC